MGMFRLEMSLNLCVIILLCVGSVLTGEDSDQDGLPDHLDIDDDNDGVIDEGDQDDDGDNILDEHDVNVPNVIADKDEVNVDSSEEEDIDEDSDGDGILDEVDEDD